MSDEIKKEIKKFPRPNTPRIIQINVGVKGLTIWNDLIEKEVSKFKKCSKS